MTNSGSIDDGAFYGPIDGIDDELLLFSFDSRDDDDLILDGIDYSDDDGSYYSSSDDSNALGSAASTRLTDSVDSGLDSQGTQTVEQALPSIMLCRNIIGRSKLMMLASLLLVPARQKQPRDKVTFLEAPASPFFMPAVRIQVVPDTGRACEVYKRLV